VTDSAPEGAADASIGALRRTLPIANKRGLHARAAAKFVRTAGQFDAVVRVSFKGQEVSGLSIMEQARIEVLAGVNLPMLVKLASVRTRPIAEAVRMAQEAGRKYITVASRILAKEAS
jgi:phosphotransferase system HPr (HPr) family protein